MGQFDGQEPEPERAVVDGAITDAYVDPQRQTEAERATSINEPAPEMVVVGDEVTDTPKSIEAPAADELVVDPTQLDAAGGDVDVPTKLPDGSANDDDSAGSDPPAE